MFNDKYGLTKAVLEGRKTQTRRIVDVSKLSKMQIDSLDDENSDLGILTIGNLLDDSRCKVGEEVAVAQSYDDIYMEKNAPCPIPEEFRLNAYNKGFNKGHKGWNNKMFVAAEDMPFRIKITNIRVERLQDISDEDCLKEGLEFANGGYYTGYNKETNSRIWLGNTSREAFAHLINKTCGKGTWDSNPWVFVYEFELIK